jgi:hypothetical protein
MTELKIKTHTTYTYETSDGREFDIVEEAQEWQQTLEDIKGITMLDSEFNTTDEVTSAFYVYIKTYPQLKAFEAMQAYEGMSAHISELGYWFYDDCTDHYVNFDKEIEKLQNMKDRLYEAANG